MQTPLAQYRPHYKENLIEVVVEISSPKAHYFKSKKFFASQKIVESRENGELVVSFKLTDTVEIESFIMSWIPFVRVIAPVSLKEQIETTLKEY
jgi:predicted DNA-binding transcriptional regulator YafY